MDSRKNRERHLMSCQGNKETEENAEGPLKGAPQIKPLLVPVILGLSEAVQLIT